jgi:hypothetical protein
MPFFREIEKKIQNNQSNHQLKKAMLFTRLQTILQSHGNKNSMVLAQEQI